MAYAPMPNIVTIHAPKISCNQLSMNALSEVLQSNSVKRLLNRQNVYLHPPLLDDAVVPGLTSSKNSIWEKINGSMSDSSSMEKMPDLSVIPIINCEGKDESSGVSIEDKHLLPSKTEGKSSVALLPLKPGNRDCGHSEPCENIICDVEFRQLTSEENDTLPLVAVNIESSEIDAPVSKHCKNEKCDALSIDHDRCRRAVVRCHRCDLEKNCDICLTVLKTRKSRLMHKNCKMRIEYRHNKTSRGQLMKDRMRVRELQILDAAKLKKDYYNDPMTGHERAIESLQRNSELIVIPKTCLTIQQHPTIRITSVTGGGMTPNVYTGDSLGKVVSRYPLVFSAAKMLAGKTTASAENAAPIQRDTTSYQTVSPQTNQFITIDRAGNVAQSVDLSDYLQTKSATQTNATSYFMPIRVVPISSLKTEPSLLHQSQGVPKFCLVSQAPNQSATFAKLPPKILPAQKTNERIVIKSQAGVKMTRKADSCGEFLLKRFKSGMRRGRRKKNGPKRASKSFECSFCFKRFSTDWYFKLHIAKHKGEIKFTCKYCKKPFMHNYNMTKHIVTMHKQEFGSDDLNITEENGDILHCSSCKVTFETINEMESHRCPVVCLRCHSRISDGDLTLHLRTKHEMSEDKALEEFVRQKRQRIIIEQNRERKRHEIEKEQGRRTKIKDEPKAKLAEHENGTLKRKRSSLNFNEEKGNRDDESNDQTSMKIPTRRLTRRRNHSLANQIDNGSTNKSTSENLEDGSTLDFTEEELISR